MLKKPMTIENRMETEAAVSAPSLSLSPIFWDTTELAPTPIPAAREMITMKIGKNNPIAASA